MTGAIIPALMHSHQNSAVKRAWARIVPGWVTSWEVLMLHPSFWVLRGTIPACHLSSQWVRPSPSPWALVDPITRSQDTGRRNRASLIFPRFLPRGRSHRLGTIGRNDRLFGRSRRKLWMETPGGGDGSRRGSVRTCFMRR